MVEKLAPSCEARTAHREEHRTTDGHTRYSIPRRTTRRHRAVVSVEAVPASQRLRSVEVGSTHHVRENQLTEMSKVDLALVQLAAPLERSTRDCIRRRLRRRRCPCRASRRRSGKYRLRRVAMTFVRNKRGGSHEGATGHSKRCRSGGLLPCLKKVSSMKTQARLMTGAKLEPLICRSVPWRAPTAYSYASVPGEMDSFAP